MLEFPLRLVPGQAAIEEFEREKLDSTGIWFCERLMEIRLVLSGNVYNL